MEGEGRQPNVVKLTGKELGDFPDTPQGLEALREAAEKELFTFRGQWIENPSLRDASGNLRKVEIRKRGIKEFIHFGANPDKLKMAPKIREIIATAKDPTWENDKPGKRPGVVGYYRMKNMVSVGGAAIPVDVLIEEDQKGLLHYDLLLPKTKAALDSAANGPGVPQQQNVGFRDSGKYTASQDSAQGNFVTRHLQGATNPQPPAPAAGMDGADAGNFVDRYLRGGP